MKSKQSWHFPPSLYLGEIATAFSLFVCCKILNYFNLYEIIPRRSKIFEKMAHHILQKTFMLDIWFLGHTVFTTASYEIIYAWPRFPLNISK